MNSKLKVLVSGSLVYDRIMDFPGYFKEHILPEKIHILNVSFCINRLQESFGGTAGNIAYNLSLLGEKPIVSGIVGEDFGKYEKWFRKNQINLSLVKKIKKENTASAYIMTDQADNQITGFYPGPRGDKFFQEIKKIKKIDLAIVSPELKERMLGHIKIYKELKIPYVFDPGQQITSFSASDLNLAIKGAKILIGNDYEIELIIKKLSVNIEKLQKFCEILVITKGSKGSLIYCKGKKIVIPPAKPKNTSDPTGAGDAYRAGLIKGVLSDWPLEKAGRLAGLVAVYTVEKYGTQTHRFSWKELEKRYRESYGEKL